MSEKEAEKRMKTPEQKARETHEQEAARLAKDAKRHFEAAIALLTKSINEPGPDAGVALNPAEAAVSCIMQGLRANTACEWHLAKLS